MLTFKMYNESDKGKMDISNKDTGIPCYSYKACQYQIKHYFKIGIVLYFIKVTKMHRSYNRVLTFAKLRENKQLVTLLLLNLITYNVTTNLVPTLRKSFYFVSFRMKQR
ncbi:unnamed protein product [Chrysodeixis includens]|uniref:Uncharacterized protein n=1 Tax=Chrysodeixis includens TaxID=689277 RepID=A0A9N8KRL8_CHRIL|nr:unnamed protein product [Chrysodeixis includens]